MTLVIDFGKRLAIDYNTLTDHSCLGVWGFPTRGLAPLGWVSASPSASATVQLPRQLGLTIVLGGKKYDFKYLLFVGHDYLDMIVSYRDISTIKVSFKILKNFTEARNLE